MGLGGILQRLKTEGVLKVYLDYRSGTFYDYSDSANTITTAVPVHFTSKGVQSNSGAFITIPNTATLQALTTGTIIARQETFTNSISYFVYKTGQFIFNHNSATNQLFLSSSVATSIYSYVGGGIATHAVDFDNAGGVPRYYRDGVSIGPMSIGLTINSSGNNIQVNFGGGAQFATSQYTLIISRKLTAAEHQELYQQLQALS